MTNLNIYCINSRRLAVTAKVLANISINLEIIEIIVYYNSLQCKLHEPHLRIINAYAPLRTDCIYVYVYQSVHLTRHLRLYLILLEIK